MNDVINEGARIRKRAYLLMVTSCLLWGGSFVVGKATVNEFPPLTLAFFRYLISAVIIFPMMIKSEGKNWRISLNDLPGMFVLAVTGGFGYVILYFLSLSFTSAINASIIVSINPMATLLISAVMLKEKLSFIKIFSLAIALVGVIITISKGSVKSISELSFNIGDIIMLLAVFLYSFYAVFSNKMMRRHSPLKITAYNFLLSLIAMIPISISEKPFEIWSNSSLGGKIAVIYLGALASALGYLLHQYSIKLIGASKTMGFYSLVPVFTTLLSFVFLGESISGGVLAGGTVIILGIYLNYGYKGKKAYANYN